ncbi:MAG: hypothetical protein CM1200mP14_09320 [Gammaproteobacteria bacterium]|nr:MAG: hypothetical protein CM1200mP14_09320 [Gammaproteobacteria bacterium]
MAWFRKDKKPLKAEKIRENFRGMFLNNVRVVEKGLYRERLEGASTFVNRVVTI